MICNPPGYPPPGASWVLPEGHVERWNTNSIRRSDTVRPSAIQKFSRRLYGIQPATGFLASHVKGFGIMTEMHVDLRILSGLEIHALRMYLGKSRVCPKCRASLFTRTSKVIKRGSVRREYLRCHTCPFTTEIDTEIISEQKLSEPG